MVSCHVCGAPRPNNPVLLETPEAVTLDSFFVFDFFGSIKFTKVYGFVYGFMVSWFHSWPGVFSHLKFHFTRMYLFTTLFPYYHITMLLSSWLTNENVDKI